LELLHKRRKGEREETPYLPRGGRIAIAATQKTKLPTPKKRKKRRKTRSHFGGSGKREKKKGEDSFCRSLEKTTISFGLTARKPLWRRGGEERGNCLSILEKTPLAKGTSCGREKKKRGGLRIVCRGG